MLKLNFVTVFIGVMLVMLYFVWTQQNNTEVAFVRSTVDGREYVVQNKADKQEAADMLARVRQKMIALVDYLKTNKEKIGEQFGGGGKEDGYGSYQERIDRLVQRFNADRISEGNEDVKYTTYTLNKGEKMVFCLRARGEDDRVHDLAMMTFVAIHELAHITSVSNHHTPEFQANFRWLLQNAVACGVYKFENFKAQPRRYCGIDVTDTPLA